MTKAADVYCALCKKDVRPVKGLVVYFCPTCGLSFMPQEVEQPIVNESGEGGPDPLD